MKKLLALTLLVLVSVAGASAAQLCSSQAAWTVTAQGWVEGCEQGDKAFANFTYNAGTTLVPGVDVSFSEEPSFDQHSVLLRGVRPNNWTQGTAGMGYDVTVINPDPYWVIKALDLGTTIGCAPAGCGSIVVTKVLSEIGNPSNVYATLVSTNGSQVLNVTLPNLRSFHVEITGLMGVSTSLNQISDNYYQGQVPEPVTMALFGSGLLVLGLLRRFRR